MTASIRLQLAAAVALLAAAPVAASAGQLAYSVGPVAIASVQNDQNLLDLPYGQQALYLNDLNVSFVNGANVPATKVEFAVNRDGKTDVIATKGSFAPGTRIDRELAKDTNTLPAADASVTISKVDFADGTTWTAATGRVASASNSQTAAR